MAVRLMWIRGPWWDGLWFLSGFPLALVVTLGGAWGGLDLKKMLAWFLIIQVIDTSHRISPILMAWRHHGFRREMMRQPVQYIAVPVLILAAGVAAGFASQRWWADAHFINNSTGFIATSLTLNPLALLMFLHYAWNIWHFGMQNFGVATIYRLRSGISYPASQRSIDKYLFLSIQVALGIQIVFSLPVTAWMTRVPAGVVTNHAIYAALGIAAFLVIMREAAISRLWFSPRILFAGSQALILFLGPGLWITVISSFNHWLTAIGLSAHVDGNRRAKSPATIVFLAFMLGIILAAVIYIDPASTSLRFLPPLIGFSVALGVVHFLYDRWVWQLSDPQVRATIGRDLFITGAAVHP
jgi:hypothetical protein